MSEVYRQQQLSNDSQALIMLCTALTLGEQAELNPLTIREWKNLDTRISHSALNGPGNLLGLGAAEISSALQVDSDAAGRMAQLLERGGQFSLALTRLQERGIWVATRADDFYPHRLREKLKDRSPVVLFAAGNLDLANREGIAVVGSREVTTTGDSFARRIGELSAANDLSVISGAARGADRIAMTSCLESGGVCVGVLADGLERVMMEREVRHSLSRERLCLLTPCLPSAFFNVGNAMNRNKLIYALAIYAIVVDSALGRGGTWEGALENIRYRWTPLFVRCGENSAPGNQDLIRRGGAPLSIDEIDNESEFLKILERKSTLLHTGSAQQGDLLSVYEGMSPSHPSDSPDAETHAAPANTPEISEVTTDMAGQSRPASQSAGHDETLSVRLIDFLEIPRNVKEIMTFLQISQRQAKAVLEQAVEEGLAVRLKKHPATYQKSKSDENSPMADLFKQSID